MNAFCIIERKKHHAGASLANRCKQRSTIKIEVSNNELIYPKLKVEATSCNLTSKLKTSLSRKRLVVQNARKQGTV